MPKPVKFDTFYKKYVTPELIVLVGKFFDVAEIRREHDPRFTSWELKIRRSGIVKHIISDHTYSEKELIVKHALRKIAGYDKE